MCVLKVKELEQFLHNIKRRYKWSPQIYPDCIKLAVQKSIYLELKWVDILWNKVEEHVFFAVYILSEICLRVK